MIGVTVDYDGNTLLMLLPTDELYDHLCSIGIAKDISIGGTEDINVKIYADNDLEVSELVLIDVLRVNEHEKYI